MVSTATIRTTSSTALVLAMQADCTTDSTLCRAHAVLHWLYVLAAILAVVLLLVIALAVHLWRRNRNAGPLE